MDSISKRTLLLGCTILSVYCGQAPSVSRGAGPDAILLVTLDTTRADSVGYANERIETPALDGLAASGLVFTQAYTTVPMTLPAHTSIMTGLYASEHGVHENARFIGAGPAMLAERLHERGYRTAAFVSAYPLSREFGIARGFGHYDDSFPENRTERSAKQTNAAAIPFLESFEGGRLFVWIHYFDPHHPYTPPEPYFSRYEDRPYLGEIAFMDNELGRLLAAFKKKFAGKNVKMIVAGDHGEGLGDHGETYHGYLLYQGTVRVPLIVAGTDIEPGRSTKPVSIRQIYHTVLSWLGQESRLGLEDSPDEIVMAEALKPYLQYGWTPQIMAVEGHLKTVFSGARSTNKAFDGKTEIYDLEKDPGEQDDLSPGRGAGPKTRAAFEAYALPVTGTEQSGPTDDQLEKLASLGYTMSSGMSQDGRRPIPNEMTPLFADLDFGSDLFGRKRYAEAVETYEQILVRDPRNFMIHLRSAVAYSVLGRREEALRSFEAAGALNQDAADLHHYLGMHYLRFGEWALAADKFEAVLEKMPDRLPAIEALARIREREGRIVDAIGLYQKAASQKMDPVLFLKLGELFMSRGDSNGAAAAFYAARDLQREEFSRYLELGVCLQDLDRYEEAAESLDRVFPDHPGYPMALYKRAQVGALLGEPDTASMVAAALENADATTRDLIERDPLLRPFLP